MWHLNVQQRSMKNDAVTSTKNESNTRQIPEQSASYAAKAMEFYKEHKFNPMGGCLPLY